MKRSDKVLFGLIGALALLVLVCAACIVGVVVLPLRWWNQGGAMQASKEFLSSNPVVLEKVGTVRRFGRIPSGSIQETNGRGQAHLTLTLEGEKGEAKATLDLSKEPGRSWKVTSATLYMEGRSFPLTVGPPGKNLEDRSPPQNEPPAPPNSHPHEQDGEGLPA